MTEPNRPPVTILGGGPAGLAAAYYIRRRGMPVLLLEKNEHPGGNCRTLSLDGLLFDTGAHRLHNRSVEITEEVRHLVGAQDLHRVEAPSAVRHGGKWLEFPLNAADLFRTLSFGELLRTGFDLLRALPGRKVSYATFQEMATAVYGKALAEMFLLNYSAKLWGRTCDRLSPGISGNRLKGLRPVAAVTRALVGRNRGRHNIDDGFYYPAKGIGMITDALADAVGRDNIRLNAAVTELHHNDERIEAVMTADGTRLPITDVVATLPLPLLIRSLRPAAPAELLETARGLCYRQLLLAVFGLERERLTPNASLYFPDPSFPFTRLYESKNRSSLMAPPHRTSIVLEIPCAREDRLWSASDDDVRDSLLQLLRPLFNLKDEEISAFGTVRLPNAYPILEVGFEEKSARLLNYLRRFRNLHLCGRNATFRYLHIHDLLDAGRQVADGIAGGV